MKGGGIAQGFVATEVEAEGVADEDLLDAFGGGEVFEKLEGVGDLGLIERRIAGAVDEAGGVDGLLLFVVSEVAVVSELFEGEAEGVHLFVAAPAFLCAGGGVKSGAEGEGFAFGNAGIDADGDVGNRAAEEVIENPLAATDGVVVEVSRPGDEPGGVGENAGPFPGGKGDRLVGGPLPVGREAVNGGVVDYFRGRCGGAAFAVDLPVDVGLVGGEEFAENFPIFLEDVLNEELEIADENVGIVNPAVGIVFENIEGIAIAEVFAEELEEARVVLFGVI